MSKVEANLQLVLQNQVTQTEILSKLLFSTYGETSLPLDDNKKGKKGQETQKEKEKENVGQQITKDQQINEHQQIKEHQQISSQWIIFGKRKSNSTSDQPTSKRHLQDLDAIEERRRAREAQTKDLPEKERMQLAELQKKTKEAISAVEKGTAIKIEPAVDSSVQSTKEYGSPSGAKPFGSSLLISLSPSKPKGKSLFQEDIFPEPKDDSQKILGNSIKKMKNREDSKENFATIYRNGKEIKVYVTHTLFNEAKNEELSRMELPSLEEQAEIIDDEADIMERLKAQDVDEALAIKLHEEEEKGLNKKKGGKKRACSSSRGRRIKRRA